MQELVIILLPSCFFQIEMRRFSLGDQEAYLTQFQLQLLEFSEEIV